jgi:membrane-associated phospholipid phosphatase
MNARRGPLDPSPADRREAALAERWRQWRDGVPSALVLFCGAVLIAVVGILVGMLLAKALGHSALVRADGGVDRWFARHRTHDLNSVTGVIAGLGGTPVVTGLAVLTVIAAALVWRRWREPALMAAAMFGEVVIFLTITTLVNRARPPVPHLDAAPPTSSFPSGHTAASVALYGAWAILSWERARTVLVRGLFTVLAVVVPVLVGIARLYRGMHFPTDVIAGALLSLAWLPLVVKAIRLGVLHHRAHEGIGARARGSVLRHG